MRGVAIPAAPQGSPLLNGGYHLMVKVQAIQTHLRNQHVLYQRTHMNGYEAMINSLVFKETCLTAY